MISGKFYPKKHYDQLFFTQKKKFRPTSQNGRFPIWDRTWDPFRESTFFFLKNSTYSYSFLGWNSTGITMSLELLHNYFMITVKCRKNDEKFGFSNFDWDPERMLKWLQQKNSVRHPKMVVFRFWVQTSDPFRESTISFSQNLTYSYSLLGWNLPGITMSLESLHIYFGITVKSRKNDKEFGFFDFCLWSRNNVGIIAPLW